MSAITAKQLHHKTAEVLDRLAQGESLVITRRGRPVGCLQPADQAKPPDWADIMAPVWKAQKAIAAKDRTPNPVLAERRRRRR